MDSGAWAEVEEVIRMIHVVSKISELETAVGTHVWLNIETKGYIQKDLQMCICTDTRISLFYHSDGLEVTILKSQLAHLAPKILVSNTISQ